MRGESFYVFELVESSAHIDIRCLEPETGIEPAIFSFGK
jgi:hypothetical protein